MVDIASLIVPSVISGGLNLLGGMATNSANAAEGDKARQWSLWMQREANAENIAAADRQRWWASDETRLQREFLAGMSNTAYQRPMQDMRTAGLNPILAAGQGGASTPNAGLPSASASSSPMGSSPVAPRMENALGAAVQSAMDVYGRLETLRRIDADIEKVKADTEVSRAQAGNVQAQTAYTDAQRLVALGVPAEQAQRIASGKASEAEAYAAADLARSRRRLTDDEREFLNRWSARPNTAGPTPHYLSVAREGGHSAASTASDAASGFSQLLQRINETAKALIPSRANTPVPPQHFNAPSP